jgi:energy-coupling factor transporter ATP-binding protein EcfA2
MKIQTVEITNYKAFVGTEKLKFDGKNVFIYGENGSGKSSLYYALKDFFQSSTEEIDFAALENIFIEENERGLGKIKVTLSRDNESPKEYHASSAGNDHGDSSDTLIRDANRLKSFITYKHLLDIHHFKKNRDINLFDLLVNGVLSHFKYSLTNGKEIGQIWRELQIEIQKPRSRNYRISQKKRTIDPLIRLFNDAFGELFKPDSPEFIFRNAKPILDEFEHRLDVKLTFPQIRPSDDYSKILNNKVEIQITYAGKIIPDPQLFLNEARLSAIAISIYLGMIKQHPQEIDYKILFLDDIFIGLDIANRLPLLKILDSHFEGYQIFITTYDKPWFEYAKTYLEQKSGWKTMEFYARTTSDGYDIPCIIDDQDLLRIAAFHLRSSDYKAAAVYARSAFEQTLQKHCNDARTPVKFRLQQKQYSSEDFWTAINDKNTLKNKSEIEKFKDLVLNPFSHYNSTKHEIKSELENAIKAIEKLKNELNDLRKTYRNNLNSQKPS